MLMRIARMRLRRHQHGQHGVLTCFYIGRNIKDPAAKGAFHRTDLSAVHPYLHRAIDSIEVQPHMPPRVTLRYLEDRSIPLWHALKTLRTFFPTIVLTPPQPHAPP